jgi:uncharacterized protein YjdB
MGTHASRPRWAQMRAIGAAVLVVAGAVSWIGLDATPARALGSPILLSVTVAPLAINVPQGETEQFTATGHYSDSSTANLTDTVTWSTSSATTATVSNSSGKQGLATAVGEGAATITATDSAALLSGDAVMTVISPALLAVTVSPALANVPVGGTQQLVATAHYSDGSTTTVTSSATWSSSASSTAKVSSKGLVTGVATGAATITAAYQSVDGTAAITVVSAVLLAIAVTPPATNLPSGETKQLTATGTYSDASTKNLTASVTWSTSDTSIASVSSAGLVTAGSSTGLATITATDASTSIDGAAAITVLPAVLLAVTVSPPVANLPTGETQQLTATGNYSDGTTANLTDSVTWSTSASSTASVSSKGLVTAGSSTGLATITATDPSSSIDGTAAMTVLPAVLLAISVTPPVTNVPDGQTQQLVATGTYSDGSTANITADVTWSSSSGTVAAVSSSGLVTAEGTGAATITAADPATSIEGTAAITVLPAVLVAISVTPPLTNLPSGETQQLTATGDYSNGSTVNLTNEVTWSTSDVSTASVSSKGLVTAGESTGLATITATDPSSSIDGTAAITVLPADLLAVVVSPPVANLPSGGTQQLTATGEYTDGSTKNLSDEVTWATSASSTATVSSTGLVTAGATTGVATITATDPSSSIDGTAAITVLPAELLAISVSPPATNLPSGETQQLTATGVYSDGTTADLTKQVTWSSSATATASVSSKGLVTAGETTGLATITASDSSSTLSGAAAVTVLPAVLLAVVVTPPASNLPSGQTQQLTATGYYSDDSEAVLSNAVTWSTSASATATVSKSGLVKAGETTGLATITATDPSTEIDGTAAITVLPAILLAITVSPPAADIASGETQQLTATADYSDGSMADVNADVTWSTSDSAVASVSSSGLVTAGDNGAATITATDTAANLSGIAAITVLPDVLVSIAIDPSPGSVPKFDSVQFTATGTYSNLTTQNITDQVTWASDNSKVASASNSSGSIGEIKGVALGTTTITATDPSSGISGMSSVTVTGPAIAVSPATVDYGGHFRVKGTGFKPGSKIKVIYRTRRKLVPSLTLCKVTVGSNGTFVCKLRLSPQKSKDGPTGAHLVEATTGKTVLASTRFTVAT